MLRRSESLPDPYEEMERIIGNLVECYAIPHARMCMRWTKPTKKAFREEIVGWLEDYGKSFRRLVDKGAQGKEDLAVFARRKLDAEIARIVRGDHPAVERTHADIFG
ncbi:MAG TPA: hypothetical protein VIB49_06545 [Thermoplasmata archaeon]|jgi:hypothetical protein